jgi:farnesyl-diphosphate farnesyltransferase
VGIGLSQIFTLRGLEYNDLTEHDHLSNSLGLFLQKTNIIRDVKEDYDEKRFWWPKDIIHTHFSSMDDVFNPDIAIASKHADLLNEMIINALQHIPDSIAYLSLVKSDSNFKFCAIPQVVAMQTLATLFNNANVFKKTEKLSKTTLARIFIDVNDMNSVLQFYIDAIEKIEKKIADNNCSHVKQYADELDKIKGVIIKYAVEHPKLSFANISLSKIKRYVMCACVSLFRNIMSPLRS